MRPTLEEREAHMRKIPLKEQEYAEKQFKTKGYIYYKRIYNLVMCTCGACGAAYAGLYKPSEDPFEAAAQHIIRPAHNKPGVCEQCGYVTQYKAEGKIRPRFVKETAKYMIGQRMGKEEFVFRVFNAEQIMYVNKKTEYVHTEYIRIFLSPGKRPQKDYQVYDCWTGRNRWIDYNLGGFANIGTPYDLEISPETMKEIKKTPMFKYIPEPEKEYSAVHYYIAAARYPDFEMIVKSGMKFLTRSLIYQIATGYRSRGKTHYDRLGIRKDRLKDLIKAEGNVNILKAYQIERKAKKRWNPEEIKAVTHRINTGSRDEIKILSEIYKYASPVRIERYIEKMIMNEGCGAFREYTDYIRMRKEMGYDLSNEIILFPKELHRRHNEMVLETGKVELDKRVKEVLERYPNIEKLYKKLSDKYSAAAGGLIIRPAKNAAEIVMEGRLLHHCVGGDMYLSRHSKGDSVILFLRKISDKDMPYITVEIKKTRIMQWYGEYDKKPDKEMITAWLNTYIHELEKREEEKQEKKQGKKQELRKTA